MDNAENSTKNSRKSVGRPKALVTLRELARTHTTAAIARIALHFGKFSHHRTGWEQAGNNRF